MSQPPFGQPPQAPRGPEQGYQPPPAGVMPPYPATAAPPASPNVLTSSVPAVSGPVGPMPPKPRVKEHRAREGAITAGVWLIAIGLVFLVKDWAGWSWGQAWPLFILAAAAASFVTRVAGRHELDAGSWSLAWPVAWFVVGLVVLAATTGTLTMGLGELLSRWWPVAFILVGIWFLVAAVWPGRRRALESLALPLDSSPVASIKVSFGAGVLEIGRAA